MPSLSPTTSRITPIIPTRDNIYAEILSIAKLFSSATLPRVITAAVRYKKKLTAVYFLRNIYVEIRVIFPATPDRPRAAEYWRVGSCARAASDERTNGRTKPFLWQCGMEDGETERVARRVRIDEDPGDRSVDKSKTILIEIPSVALLFLYFYFAD